MPKELTKQKLSPERREKLKKIGVWCDIWEHVYTFPEPQFLFRAKNEKERNKLEERDRVKLREAGYITLATEKELDEFARRDRKNCSLFDEIFIVVEKFKKMYGTRVS